MEMSLPDVQGLIAEWWYAYDQGEFAAMAALLTEDVHFRCESDSGRTEYEEFIRCDIRGRDSVMQWQTEHRLGSPFPLRHNGTNIHLTRVGAAEAHFASYLFVTQIVAGKVSPSLETIGPVGWAGVRPATRPKAAAPSPLRSANVVSVGRCAFGHRSLHGFVSIVERPRRRAPSHRHGSLPRHRRSDRGASGF